MVTRIALILLLLRGCYAVAASAPGSADEQGGIGRAPLDRLLFPPAVQDRLALSQEQKTQITKLAQDFVAQHRSEISALAKEINNTLRSIRQARQENDRQAFGDGQVRTRELLKKLAGFRADMEPALLKVMDDDQKQKYREVKPDLLRPGVMFGLLQDRTGNSRTPSRQENGSTMVPLTDMHLVEYHGFKGGLYPEGINERPAAHESAGRALSAQVEGLDPAGRPAPHGKIVLLTVGMSNTSQASAGLMAAAAHDSGLNPQMVIVNGAQGGQTAARTIDPDDHSSGTAFWKTIDERLHGAGLTPLQVQVAWVKQADAGPTQGFPEYAKTLENELTRLMQVLHRRFPNLKLVYLSSRTYGGFAKTGLNPEPYAYESGFSVKWLVERQLKGDPALNFDPAKGPVTAPWLSWGPYLWANGTAARNDGFCYEEHDFTSRDGTHESPSGQQKVGLSLLMFFKTDSTTRGWFLKHENEH
jgi:hypothetical protein